MREEELVLHWMQQSNISREVQQIVEGIRRDNPARCPHCQAAAIGRRASSWWLRIARSISEGGPLSNYLRRTGPFCNHKCFVAWKASSAEGKRVQQERITKVEEKIVRLRKRTAEQIKKWKRELSDLRGEGA
jgi:hypothetical protein